MIVSLSYEECLQRARRRETARLIAEAARHLAKSEPHVRGAATKAAQLKAAQAEIMEALAPYRPEARNG